jgi:hypothetical protein
VTQGDGQVLKRNPWRKSWQKMSPPEEIKNKIVECVGSNATVQIFVVTEI